MSILRREHRAPDTSVPTPSDSVSPQGLGPSAPTDARVPPRTRAGSTWVMACVAVLVLIALIIFVAQNSGSVEVSFLSLHGRFSLAVALLAAAAAGCVLALILGTTRILQLRRVVRRRHREDLAAAPPAEPPQTLGTSPRLPESPDSTQEGLEGSPQTPDTRG